MPNPSVWYYNARTNVLLGYDVDDLYGSSGGMEDVLPYCHVDPITNININIMSERLGTDKGIANFTRIDATSNSVVDYGISSPTLVELISEFRLITNFRSQIISRYQCPLDVACLQTNHAPSWAPYDKYNWS